jgi:hypothetical protein
VAIFSLSYAAPAKRNGLGISKDVLSKFKKNNLSFLRNKFGPPSFRPPPPLKKCFRKMFAGGGGRSTFSCENKTSQKNFSKHFLG